MTRALLGGKGGGGGAGGGGKKGSAIAYRKHMTSAAPAVEVGTSIIQKHGNDMMIRHERLLPHLRKFAAS